MAQYVFWKFRWAYNADDPAVTFVKGPEGTGYYSGYSASGAFRGSYLRVDDPITGGGGDPVVAPAAPEPINQQFAGWGKVIPISMGQRRMSPQIIWLRNPVSIGVTATADFAVSWGYNADDNPDDTVVTALYADATLIWTSSQGALLPGAWSWTYYPGTETQLPDPTMVAANGADSTPAYRNQIYAVFLNFPLELFGYKLPGISAEISGAGAEEPRTDTWSTVDKHPDVTLLSDFTIRKDSAPASDDMFLLTSVRSRTSHRRGQYYFELRLDAQWRGAWYSFAGIHGIGGGVALATYSLAQQAGVLPGSVGAATTEMAPSDAGKRLRSDYYHVDGPTQWDPGQTLGFHVNMDEGWAKARNVSLGEAWTAPCYYIDPPNTTGTIEIGDSLYVHASLHFSAGSASGITGSDQQTVNFGGSPFVGAIPAGATAWNGDGGTGAILGLLPLRDFISKISTYCGLVPETDLDFVGIDDVIHGGLITRDTTFSDFLTVLGRAYGFDFFEGEQIRIVRRVIGTSYIVDKEIPREDLIVEGDRSISTTRRNDDAPTEIELSYIDRTQQFRWNIQKARRILFPVKTTRSIRKDAFAIPIITLADNALTMAGRALYREAMQNVDHEASMLPRHIAVEPSDILTITAGDTEYTVKVTSISMNADSRLAFTAVNLLTDEDMAWNAEAGSPNLPYQGSRYLMEVEEGADVFSGTQDLPSLLLGSEGADVFAGVVITVPIVTMATTEGADVFVSVDTAADPTLVLDLDFTTMG